MGEILGELKSCGVGYQEMAHVSNVAGFRQFRLDQLHRPHRVVLARDEQEPN